MATPDTRIERRQEIVARHLGPEGTMAGQRRSSERLFGRNILVTGASSGIGRAFAERAALNGANVIINARRADVLGEVADSLTCLNVKVGVVPGDVTDPETAAKTAWLINKRFSGKLHGFFSNAGDPQDKYFHLMSDDEFMAVMNVHLIGGVRMVRAVLPQIRKAAQEDGYGRVVFNSSITARDGNEGQTNYGAAKAALEGFGRSLAKEVLSDGITVNSVQIGPVDTGVWDKATRSISIGYRRTFGKEAAADLEDPLIAIKHRTVLAEGGLMSPEQVAGNISKFFSPEAILITGQTLLVDGGFSQSTADDMMLLTKALVEQRVAERALEQAQNPQA